jgi:ATP-dependent Clp protease adapter protein ClpS
MSKTATQNEREIDLEGLQPWREYEVILFNDDVHSMDEVIEQIVRALSCTSTLAEQIMMKAHSDGQAVVAVAGRPKALRIASVLRQIQLRVSLRQLN